MDRHTKGGGFLIAIHKSIHSKRIESCKAVEILVVDIWLRNKPRHRLILIYTPSKQDVTYLHSLINAINEVINDNVKYYMILGDMNIPNEELIDPKYENKEPHKSLNNFLSSNQPLLQNINSPTRGINTLDYILTNNKSTLNDITFFLL